MRRPTQLLLAAVVLLIVWLTYMCSTLIALLFESGKTYAILPDEIPAPGAKDERAVLIPKILHQTYINDSIPKQWQEGQKACVDLHPDWKYIVCCPT